MVVVDRTKTSCSRFGIYQHGYGYDLYIHISISIYIFRLGLSFGINRSVTIILGCPNQKHHLNSFFLTNQKYHPQCLLVPEIVIFFLYFCVFSLTTFIPFCDTQDNLPLDVFGYFLAFLNTKESNM